MAGAKKFGTFGGVFTPSILTILGVIMYMRLGWVVGNAGLIGAIILIVVAHIISVTTGLSISSIATDKKVGAGGVYYVLSRSLGLPIGGAIGITLWVATALSIALYLVGFAESFNAYFGLDISINGLRIAGTVALLALAAIAIISTAVAIKAQYFIMGAIVLSLIAIFAGTWEFAPEAVASFGPKDGPSMMTIFAILFPAVTGFTAGIAMSGDLEDPKKSIPGGTIAAIVVGFVVYTGLAIFMAYAIDPELLRTDYNVLMKIALFAPAVVAGIWGATLSSALGGILGGPRILQAMSIDRITPKLFGKGVGKDNEPRNALFITLFIAWGGVLIGELDMIAEVCSMFYLAAYGFINLSFFLESWASADFSPSFKVKRWIGLLGFIATFAVMFQLNPGAMVAAFVVIGGIYFFLQRKQLALGSGDIWNSVWSSLVLKGLQRMDNTEDASRNWKPNILLFSGGTENRPHLIEIAKAIAGKVGMVSNFDLIENPNAETLFPKHEQSVHDPILSEYGIFGRKQEVQNIFKGIETIASTYGFSGVEPNTVLLGWAKNTKDPIWFAQMTQKLIELDYNVLYLDYDWDKKFGKYQRIDIWWQNLHNNAELTLNLVKFITTSDEWRRANIRVILINNSSKEGYERRIHKMLDTYRIEGTVKVINNHLTNRSSFELMKTNSDDADLILASIPHIPHGEEKSFVEDTTEMFKSIGTTLLVKTSSVLGEDVRNTQVDNLEVPHISSGADILPAPTLPVLGDATAQEKMIPLVTLMDQHCQGLMKNELASFQNIYSSLIQDCRKIIIEQSSSSDQLGEMPDQVAILNAYQKRISQFKSDDIPYLEERLNSMTAGWWNTSQEALKVAPKAIKIEGKRKNVKRHLERLFQGEYLDAYKRMQLRTGSSGSLMKEKLKDGLIESIHCFSQDGNHDELIKKCFDELLAEVQREHRELSIYYQNSYSEMLGSLRDGLEAKDFDPSDARSRKERKAIISEIEKYPEHWARNERLLTSKLATDLKLQEVNLVMTQVGSNVQEEIEKDMFVKADERLSLAKAWFEELQQKVAINPNELPEVNQSLAYNDDHIQDLLARAQRSGETLPEELELMEPDSLTAFHAYQGEEVESIVIDPRASFSHLVNMAFQRPLQKHLLSAYQGCMEILSKVQLDITQITQRTSQLKDAPDGEELRGMASESLSHLTALKEELSGKHKLQEEKLIDIVHTAKSSMNTWSLLEYAVRVLPTTAEVVNQKGIKKWINSASNKAEALVDKYGDIITNKSEEYGSGDGISTQSASGSIDIHYALKQFVNELKPEKRVLDEIPFYYKQLFIGNQAPSVDQLHHRERELKQALAISNSANTSEHSIVVLGTPLSGKSFFAESVARTISGGKMIKIQAPVNGSLNKQDFLRTLQKQIRSSNAGKDAIKEAAPGTVFLFEDIELWWDRSDTSGKLIRYINELVNQYGGKYKFILTCNQFAFKIMEGQGHLRELSASRVYLRDFDEASLQKLLLSRHQAGGLRFELDGKDEDDVSSRTLRRFMHRSQEQSKGIVGVALHQWLANIKACQNDEIELILPREKILPQFEDKEWLVILSQFIIHKHLDAKRLQKLFSYQDHAHADRIIKQLQADGILVDVMGSTYKIDPMVVVWIMDRAAKYGLI